MADVVHRIVQLAQEGDPVMLPRCTVAAMCKCVMILRASNVVLEKNPRWDSAAILRASREALQLLENVSRELQPVPAIRGLHDLRDAS